MSVDLKPPPILSLHDIAFFSDVDGTLVEIEQQPEAVIVPDSLRALLERLAASANGALAFVSGRSIAQLDRLFAPLTLSASGLHGLEQRLLPDGVTQAMEAAGALEEARVALERFAQGHPGTLFEDKGLTLALHYRMAAEHREKALILVRKLASSVPGQLVLLEGKMVFELKPPGFDKGRAIANFMQGPPFRGRRPIFAGDDVTDEAGFEAVNDMDGIAIRIGVDDRPTKARFSLPNVDAMLAWMGQLSDGLGEKA